MSGLFRLTRVLRHSTTSEFMNFTARLAPSNSNNKPLGWWDGGYIEKPREKVTPYDFGYPMKPSLTEKGKVAEEVASREKSQ